MSDTRKDLSVGRSPAGLITVSQASCMISLSNQQAGRLCDILDMWNRQAQTVPADNRNRTAVMIVPLANGVGLYAGSDRIDVATAAISKLTAALRNSLDYSSGAFATALAGGDRTDMELSQIARAVRELRSELNTTNMILMALVASQASGDGNGILEALKHKLSGDDQ